MFLEPNFKANPLSFYLLQLRGGTLPHIRGTFLDLACNSYRIKLRTSPQFNFLMAYDLSTKQSATESIQSPRLLSRYD